MGSFSYDSKKNKDIDIAKLREDLMNEFGAQMVTFTGAIGYSDMCDAQNATEEQLIDMALKEGISLDKYRR